MTDLLYTVIGAVLIVAAVVVSVKHPPTYQGRVPLDETPLMLSVVTSPAAHVRQVPAPVMPTVPVAHAADVLSVEGRAVVATAEAILADGRRYLDVEQDGGSL